MSDDKTEEPTDKKIEDARKKGQIAMSRDLAKVGPLLAIAEIAFITEPQWRGAVHSQMELGLMRIGQPFLPALMEVMTGSGILLLITFLMCFVVCIPVAVVFHWGQFGILIAPEAATMKFDKLNPVNGIKGIFSKKKLFEVMISVAKASLIGWFVYIQVRSELPSIIQLAGGSPSDAYFGFIGMLRDIFHALVGVCILVGIVDLGIQKAFHKKDLMMDKEEIKREYKESEGDPMVKGQRKQLAREWANEEPAARTENANAVVVNPTHFAVAMFYDPSEAMVPVVLAKGKDDIAQAMIRRAREHNIPVIRHVWLARTLYATGKADNVIPKSSYEAVAQVYAVVNELVAMQDTGREVELESLGEPPESYRKKENQ
ncbi:type III secretion system export apparatus subunit SctU [Pseudoduganella namucuonensis]|uniref:Type III secretion protein U n=1 Tax=Pseudoduganella namucuonensis TaxID=1035707 RepID=A0A1I7LW66_9BURK|nr:type III secretion system export apparatus subunit SctU [Pseudoduganella namucuonensis]SFV13941.1 type III secretion protein U [Pseudoduganella namucuonensis]